jgi:hypothetical protein
MAMRIEGSHVYPAPVDDVMAMFRDQTATVDRYQSMGHRDVEILEFAADDDTVRIVSSRLVDVELPGFAKKALKPTNTMRQTDEWHRQPDGSWSGTFDVDVQGAPVHIGGTMTLTADPDGARHAVELDLQVKVPLIGGRIADWVGKNDGQRSLEAEFAFNDQRLRGG